MVMNSTQREGSARILAKASRYKRVRAYARDWKFDFPCDQGSNALIRLQTKELPAIRRIAIVGQLAQ